MSFYKCGHDRRKMFFKTTESFLFVQYEQWRKTKGFQGDCSLCWDCFINSIKSEEKKQ